MCVTVCVCVASLSLFHEIGPQGLQDKGGRQVKVQGKYLSQAFFKVCAQTFLLRCICVCVCVWECALVRECVGRERNWQRRWCDLTWLRLVKDAPGLCGSQCKPARSNPHPLSFPHSLCLSILSSFSSQHPNVHLYLLSSLFAQAFCLWAVLLGSFHVHLVSSLSLHVFLSNFLCLCFSAFFTVCLLPLQWSLSVSLCDYYMVMRRCRPGLIICHSHFTVSKSAEGKGKPRISISNIATLKHNKAYYSSFNVWYGTFQLYKTL